MVPEYVTVQRLSHRPISAVLDSMILPEPLVVAFLKGELRVGDVTTAWRSLVRSCEEIESSLEPGFQKASCAETLVWNAAFYRKTIPDQKS